MAITTADKTPISLANLARNNDNMKEYIQGEIDKIPTGGSITIDDALSNTSENPVQNKVINAALSEKADSSHTHTKAEITDFPTSLPASDVKAWAKADTKPTYTASEVGADASGSANTALTNAKSYTDTKIADLINGAPSTLDTLGEIAEAMENNQSVVEALDTAIGTKANESDLTSHTGNTSNPHNVTKSQVGLGNVENKSSETIRGELTSENVVNAIGYTPLNKSGDTMTGTLVAQSNTDYTTAQVRNATMSTSAPSGGSNGQVHYQYS